MKLIDTLLLIAAALLFLAGAHPRVRSTWDLVALGLLCWVMIPLIAILNSF